MKEHSSDQNNRFELRSDKVRSIVGQMSSSLVRHGIVAIGSVLVCLFVVAWFLPYRQVYSGTAVVSHSPEVSSDSTGLTVLLRFVDKRPSSLSGQKLLLISPQGQLVGSIQSLSLTRDTLERQKCFCRFKSSELKKVECQTVDFQIVCSSGNLLQKMLGGN